MARLAAAGPRGGAGTPTHGSVRAIDCTNGSASGALTGDAYSVPAAATPSRSMNDRMTPTTAPSENTGAPDCPATRASEAATCTENSWITAAPSALARAFSM
jgi:hypothetical protein